MNEYDDNNDRPENEYERRRLERQKRRHRAAVQRTVFLIFLILLFLAVAAALTLMVLNRGGISLPSVRLPFSQTESTAGQMTEAGTTETSGPETPAAIPETEPQTACTDTAEYASILSQAALTAAGYDYDGAISILQTIPAYESYSEVTSLIAEYETERDNCVAVDVTTVPHVFFHSLLVDTSRAFDTSLFAQYRIDGFNAWMTTVDEFDKIIQSIYDKGYVLVRLRDLVIETTDAEGNVTFTANTNLMLPADKKALVLSVDDLSYYHVYEGAGFADKLVFDENGVLKCHYVAADGTELIGDYDVVPRLETFLAEHPDFSYQGARGILAMTGYNGVFGYRTDADYEEQLNLTEDQAAWLAANPDYDRQSEIEQATVIADTLKEMGWEFASHTWGHLSVSSKTLEELITDNEKWVANVQNIVGEVDTIIFAHGNDIGNWEDYSEDNELYAYYKSCGYNFFCNVDASVPYWVQIRSDYVRQSRIDLDGYRIYEASIGNTTVLDAFFDATEVFDTTRPTPVVANGE